MNDAVDNAAGTVEGWLSALPFGEQLGPILVVLAILIVGLLVAKLIRGFVRKALKKIPALNRRGENGELIDLATPISTMLYYLIVLFVLIAVLERMGMNNVLDPLKNMANSFVGYIPKIIGAGIVGYAGYLIATIVSELVGTGLSKVDQQLAVRTGNADLRVASFGRTFVFAAILLPLIVAALGVLDIEAISVPATAMIQEFMAAIPNIIGAVIIIAVTWFVAKFIVQLLQSLLDGMGVDNLPSKLGVSGIFSESYTVSKMVGQVVMFFAMLTGVTAAVDRLDISIISDIMARVIEFGGGILVGGIILLVGNFLSTIAYEKIKLSGNNALAGIARLAILGLVLAMGLKAMGLADNIVNMAFGFTLGSVAVAAALAFGLGGREAAKTVADNWAKKIG